MEHFSTARSSMAMRIGRINAFLMRSRDVLFHGYARGAPHRLAALWHAMSTNKAICPKSVVSKV